MTDNQTRVLEAFGAARFGVSVRCPAHEDNVSSLSIGEGADGRVLLTCHAGCATPDVLAAAMLTMEDLQPPKGNGATTALPQDAPNPAQAPRTKRRVVEEYIYYDELFNPLYKVVRYDPKGFSQARYVRDGGGSWEKGTGCMDGVKRILFRLPEVLEAARAGGTVFVVEGEKDVLALERLGVTATTCLGGAGKHSAWYTQYSAMLKPAGLVVVIPDNDQAGRDHAVCVQSSLMAEGIRTVFLELPGPPKSDAADWIAAGGTKDQLLSLVLAKADPFQQDSNQLSNPAAELLDLLSNPDKKPAIPAELLARTFTNAQLLVARSEATDWIWGDTGAGVAARGDIIAVGGYSGEGKSALMYALASAHAAGRPFLNIPTARRALKTLVISEGSKRQAAFYARAYGKNSDQDLVTTVFLASITSLQVELLLDALRPDVLFFDTLTAIAPALELHGRQEFSWTQPGHVTAVAVWFRGLVDRYNLSSLYYLCHTTKSSKNPKDHKGRYLATEPTITDFRGTGSLVEQADSAWILRGSKDGGEGSLTRVKSRAMHETAPAIPFRFNEETAAFVVEHVDDAGASDDAAILEILSMGASSNKRLAIALARKKETVVARVASLIERGIVTRNEAGQLTLTPVPDSRERGGVPNIRERTGTPPLEIMLTLEELATLPCSRLQGTPREQGGVPGNPSPRGEGGTDQEA